MVVTVPDYPYCLCPIRQPQPFKSIERMELKNETSFLQYIQAAIENNKLVLPTLPEVALNVRQAVNSGNASDAELARIIAGDPALSARLLQVANSPLYRARQKIENLGIPLTGVTTMGRFVVHGGLLQGFG